MRPAEQFWRSTHGRQWIQTYLDSVSHPNREAMADALTAVAPFDTALDLGCHCGVLLPFLLQASPTVSITGIDVSLEALAEARHMYPQHLWIHESVVDWMPLMADYRKYDIVVSSSCLEHIEPQDIDVVLQAMTKMAQKAIVIQEVTTNPIRSEGPSPCAVPEWRHDYQKRFEQLGWQMTALTWQAVTTFRPGAVMTFVRGEK